MGISRSSANKKRASGGRKNKLRKKRKYEMGRPAAMTRIGAHRVRTVRARGGHEKKRALRLDTGNFAWGSEGITRKTRILTVTYNASNNELVRTNTLVKNAIVQIDAAPFKAFFAQRYGDAKKTKKQTTRDASIEAGIKEQLASGRVLACISSRPGQTGRCDGYLLEGPELAFYSHKQKKK